MNPSFQTILIADDEPMGRELLQALLHPLGCKLAFAVNGEETLAQAAALKPDLILLDVMMPGMDGFEVCRRLRADGDLAEVPVIIVTALDDRDSRLQGLEAGADDFISKPYDRHELRLRVKTIMRLNRYRHLLAERSKFEQVIELSPDGILVVGVEGDILLANPAMREMIAVDHVEGLQGLNFLAVVAQDQKQIIGDHISELLANEARTLRLESAFVRMNGGEFPVEISARYFPWDNQPAIQIITRDITQKKALEAKFFRAQRLQSLGTLAGGIAHDLNNVLTPILAATDLLGHALRNDPNRRFVEALATSAQRGAGIVRQILAFARGGEGRPKALKIKYVVAELQKILTNALPQNVGVQVRVVPNAVEIAGDPTQLHQVLMNLCVNARDAMPDGGVLMITVENVWLDETETEALPGATPGKWLRTTVADTGTGMTLEIQNHLFETFFTTKPNGKGTGLGLSTVRTIIKNHGGFLKVESEPGVGTQVHVFLPAAMSSPDIQGDEKPAEPPKGHGEGILVAEGDNAIQEIVKATLEFHGYHVFTAKDGAEAVAAFSRERGKIRVFIADSRLMYLDGISTIRAVHKLKPDVRCILLSGEAEACQNTENGNETSFELLPKPFTPASLLWAVAKTLPTR